MRVCIVTFPLEEAGVVFLGHLIDIFYEIFGEEVVLVSGDAGYKALSSDKRVTACNIAHVSSTNPITRALNYGFTQLKISWRLLKTIRSGDLCVFPFGGEGLLLPLLSVRVRGGRTFLALTGTAAESAQAKKDPLTKAISFIAELSFRLANGIIVYVESDIKTRRLERYKSKVIVAQDHFLDFSKFRVRKPLSKRENLVGYIGRLSEEKGVLNFIRAIPLISNNIQFLVAGDGYLRDRIDEGLVEYVGWIPHEGLPKYLNKLKLLVVPSYAEGLPAIVLEAMACGTPVLATSVGGIPDVVKDGETGFILENNSPECIVEGIDRVMSCSDLEQITKNARKFVKEHFTFETAVESYRQGGLGL